MSAAAASLVVIADVANFAAVTTITHDEDFVQVTILARGTSQTYWRALRGRSPERSAQHVEEVAALVSTPALVAWLIDCGFILSP